MSTKPARAAGLYPRLGVSSPFDAHHDLVTSSLISPLALVILRLTLGTYALFVTLFQLIWDAVKTDGADGCVPQFSIGIHCAAHTRAHRGLLLRPSPSTNHTAEY